MKRKRKVDKNQWDQKLVLWVKPAFNHADQEKKILPIKNECGNITTDPTHTL